MRLSLPICKQLTCQCTAKALLLHVHARPSDTLTLSEHPYALVSSLPCICSEMAWQSAILPLLLSGLMQLPAASCHGHSVCVMKRLLVWSTDKEQSVAAAAASAAAAGMRTHPNPELRCVSVITVQEHYYANAQWSWEEQFI